MSASADLAPQCQVEHCITCGDEAVAMRVLALDRGRGLALCGRADGRRETVEVALVERVAVDDTVLVHAGVALQRMEAPA
jgi:hydrogenase maturation factor